MGASNNFNGNFGGDYVNGDKYFQNPAPLTWSDLDNETLKTERKLCDSKIWELRSKRVIPIVWGVLGALLSLYCLVKLVFPNMTSITSSSLMLIYAVLFFGMVLPCIWLWWIRRQDDQLLHEYKRDFQTITIILRKRGVL